MTESEGERERGGERGRGRGRGKGGEREREGETRSAAGPASPLQSVRDSNVCVRETVCVCVCVCKRERESEREQHAIARVQRLGCDLSPRNRSRQQEIVRKGEGERERERERDRERERGRERERVHAWVPDTLRPSALSYKRSMRLPVEGKRCVVSGWSLLRGLRSIKKKEEGRCGIRGLRSLPPCFLRGRAVPFQTPQRVFSIHTTLIHLCREFQGGHDDNIWLHRNFREDMTIYGCTGAP